MKSSRKEHRCVIAGYKSWNQSVFDTVISKYPGRWHLVTSPQKLTLEWLQEVDPTYIFFMHWSWKVPNEIVNLYKCICFHMTDVPYGRGGSPLQNLIVRGHHHTKLAALRMVESFDAGPVYFKEDLSLEGSAEEIYIRASYLAAEMILKIIEEKIEPVPQTGHSVIFNRRRPEESRISKLPNLQTLYDFIRMLDAEGYPHSFLEHQGFRYEFTRGVLYDGRIVADVVITPLDRLTTNKGEKKRS